MKVRERIRRTAADRAGPLVRVRRTLQRMGRAARQKVQHARSLRKLLPYIARPYFDLFREGFDRRYGVRTNRLVLSDYLEGFDSLWGSKQLFSYMTLSGKPLLAFLRRQDVDWTDFAFLDVGCGLGKPMMTVADLPFRSIHGVELDPELVRGARSNVDTFCRVIGQPRERFVIHEGDGASHPLPEGDLLLYLFNPFAKQPTSAVRDAVDAKLKAEPLARILVVYDAPLYGFLFESVEGLREIALEGDRTRAFARGPFTGTV